jgi:DNA gyrase/topoisomerase IV subunit B
MSQYQKLSGVEHVLKRPGMYIGSIEQEESETFVLNDSGNGIVQKTIKYSPGLYKIFDEIIVNAIDHAVRLYTSNSTKKDLLSEIRVDINKEDGSISVWNNGKSIEIAKHNVYNEWIPEIIFGNLRSSENFNDDEVRIVGGVNGLGSKCTNIFSMKFIVDIGNSQTKKRYYQEYSSNMSKKSVPKITTYTGKDYVNITFYPDFTRFHTTGLSDNMISLMSRRVYDIVACTKWLMAKKKSVKVLLNGEPIEISDFTGYAGMYPVSETIHESPNTNWDIGVGLSGDGFQQVSFVNGIFTKNGGKHVDYILDQIISRTASVLTKRNKGLTIKKSFIKNNLFLFVRSNIDRPSFNSQCKDELNTPKSKFGSIGVLSDKFIDNIGKMGLYDRVVDLAEFKGSKDLAKTDGKKKSRVIVPKYDTAQYAGTEKSNKCTLILTEGDSCTSDTPLLLRKDGNIIIKTIDNIENDIWHDEEGREHTTSDYEIWSDNGWTKIKYVMRHRVKKRMYRILTHTGFIEVTEDHSLLNENGHEITPYDCKVGARLLHNFPSFKKIDIPDNLNECSIKELWSYASKSKIQYYMEYSKKVLIEKLLKIKNRSIEQLENNDISLDEAYAMGLFWSDGCTNIYDRNEKGTFFYWAIDNTNMDFLEKAKIIMESLYELEFKISLNGTPNKESHLQMYRLLAYGGIKSKHLVSKYRELFYDKNSKKCIPSILLNSNIDIRKQFFQGFYDGDGSKTGNERFDVYGKIGAHGMYTICKSIGYDVSINNRHDKPDVYRLNLTGPSSHLQLDPCAIKKIVDMGIVDNVVYDIETENHHFQGGIGQMIIHNSAKTLALSGLSIEQRKYFGIYPLKGKCLNVRDVSLKKLGDNVEINALKKIIGLEQGKVYKDLSSLRYGKVMIMTDSDVDGSHIKGLLFNIFSVLWPSLFKYTDFLASFLTPIVKITNKRTKAIKSFYTLQDYEEWKRRNPDSSGFAIKYYKGLGTSTKEEAKEYFKNIGKNLLHYEYNANTEKSFDLAFNKKNADDRKTWLGQYNRLDTINSSDQQIQLDDFIHKDLIHFSNDDLSRSIPNMLDGLKVSQRKVLFSAFKRNLTNEIKVSQFAGYVSEHSAYHHGEKSLEDAIVGLTRNFVGSNNINLLIPSGQLGSRLQGGKDSAAPRYIFTALSPITKHIYNPLDFPLMEYLEDDGMKIEPLWYIPVIPMILVNGARGIGTGFSTNIPSYNPLEIIENIRGLLANKKMKPMIPWYNKFTGTTKKISSDTFHTTGTYKKTINNSVIITELPIGTWSESYSEYLKSMIGDGIKDVDIRNTDEDVNMVVKFDKNSKDIDNLLKMTSIIKTSNMHVFDKDSRIIKYNNPNAIINDFFDIRMEYYAKRKEHILNNLMNDLSKISAKTKFIIKVNEGILNIKQDTEKVVEYLVSHKYPKIEDSYDYLLGMPMRSMTKDNVLRLKNQKQQKELEYDTYSKHTIQELWLQDLESLEKEYRKTLKM